jgi:hypothetical protein
VLLAGEKRSVQSFGSQSGMARSIWVLRCGSRTLSCRLDDHDARGLVLAVAIDGMEIAARACASRAEASRCSAMLFDRLRGAGWSVWTGQSDPILH